MALNMKSCVVSSPRSMETWVPRTWVPEIAGIAECADTVEKLNLHDFRKETRFTDVALVIGDVKLYVNKMYLAQWSPVWEAMFLGDFVEKGQKEIELPGKEWTEIAELLHCIHPTHKAVKEKNVYFLLELAEEYQIESMKTRCEDYLIATKDGLSIKAMFTAMKFNLTRLHKKCVADAIERLPIQQLVLSR